MKQNVTQKKSKLMQLSVLKDSRVNRFGLFIAWHAWTTFLYLLKIRICYVSQISGDDFKIS